MKKTVILLSIGLFIVGCLQEAKEKQQVRKNQTTYFSWLLGKWESVGDSDKEYQYWTQKGPTTFHEIAYSFPAPDTLIVQKIEVTKQKDQWTLSLKYPYEPAPFIYKVTNLEENTFTCKNDSVSFPQSINYQRNGDSLHIKLRGKIISTEMYFTKIADKN